MLMLKPEEIEILKNNAKQNLRTMFAHRTKHVIGMENARAVDVSRCRKMVKIVRILCAKLVSDE